MRNQLTFINELYDISSEFDKKNSNIPIFRDNPLFLKLTDFLDRYFPNNLRWRERLIPKSYKEVQSGFGNLANIFNNHDSWILTISDVVTGKDVITDEIFNFMGRRKIDTIEHFKCVIDCVLISFDKVRELGYLNKNEDRQALDALMREYLKEFDFKESLTLDDYLSFLNKINDCLDENAFAIKGAEKIYHLTILSDIAIDFNKKDPNIVALKRVASIKNHDRELRLGF